MVRSSAYNYVELCPQQGGGLSETARSPTSDDDDSVKAEIEVILDGEDLKIKAIKKRLKMQVIAFSLSSQITLITSL